MINSISALTFKAPGPPLEALELEQLDLRNIQPNEVLVKMQCAPINPADLNMIEGQYATRPELPAIAGIEGVGMVMQKGLAVSEFQANQQVIAPRRTGTWCDAYIAKEDELVPVPPGISKEQASMMAINPATAWRMLHDYVDLKPGDWVIQNAANSGVGHNVIQIAKSKWIKTINIVRRPEQIEPLKKMGATVVIVQSDHVAEEVKDATGGATIQLGLNATGGPILRSLIRCLSPAATLVTYGAMSREPFTIGNGLLIFKDIRVRGFWISNWYRTANQVAVRQLFAALTPMLKSGVLNSPVEKTYPFHQWQQAVAHASQESRNGKILFNIS